MRCYRLMWASYFEAAYLDSVAHQAGTPPHWFFRLRDIASVVGIPILVLYWLVLSGMCSDLRCLLLMTDRKYSCIVIHLIYLAAILSLLLIRGVLFTPKPAKARRYTDISQVWNTYTVIFCALDSAWIVLVLSNKVDVSKAFCLYFGLLWSLLMAAPVCMSMILSRLSRRCREWLECSTPHSESRPGIRDQFIYYNGPHLVPSWITDFTRVDPRGEDRCLVLRFCTRCWLVDIGYKHGTSSGQSHKFHCLINGAYISDIWIDITMVSLFIVTIRQVVLDVQETAASRILHT